MQKLKSTLDPNHILNPGKVLLPFGPGVSTGGLPDDKGGAPKGALGAAVDVGKEKVKKGAARL
ncbi:hypothetical protein BC829DRAFT_395609 [Chytridium lagenaria]|nr:hypothetical protein BC829DRAFT_395609 [Chytridium lagenaria]